MRIRLKLSACFFVGGLLLMRLVMTLRLWEWNEIILATAMACFAFTLCALLGAFDPASLDRPSPTTGAKSKPGGSPKVE